MRFFSTIRAKLAGYFLLSVCMLVILGGYSVYTMQMMHRQTREITELWAAGMYHLNEVLDGANKVRRAELARPVGADAARVAVLDKNDAEGREQIKTSLENFKKTIASADLSASEKGKYITAMDEIERLWQNYEAINRQVVADCAAGKKSEAAALSNAKGLDAFNSLFQALDQLLATGETNMRRLEEQGGYLYARSFAITIGLIAVAVLLAAVVGWMTARVILRSVRNLGEISREVGNGNLSVRAREGSDELGKLGVEYNAMIAHIKKVISQIQKASSQTAAASEQMSASTDQSAQTTRSVSVYVGEIAEMANCQVGGAEMAVNVIATLNEHLPEATQMLEESATRSEEAVEMAREGHQSIRHAIDQMSNIENTVGQSAAVVTHLGARSGEIGQIVDTIAGIAGQTNLLALNAAIEAARAGEQGKGFAVVAEEVRKLAEQSHEAAEKIAALIGEIQAETEQAVTAMQNGTAEVKAGTQIVDTAGSHFTNIMERINTIYRHSKRISESVQQLTDGTRKVLGAAKQGYQLGKDTAGKVAHVSEVMEEQTATMEEMADGSHSLAELAQELEDTGSKFKL